MNMRQMTPEELEALGPTKQYISICHTDGCPNENLPFVNELRGEVMHFCGGCNTIIDDVREVPNNA